MAPAGKLSFDNVGEFTATRANELFESHKKYLEWRKSEWASRGPDALKKRLDTRAATHTSWRQMKGLELAKHEMNHPGNKPFVIGMGVMTVLYMWTFVGQSQSYRESNEYWSKYQMKKH